EPELADGAVVAELDRGITGDGGDVRGARAVGATAAVAARAGDDRAAAGVLELERPAGVVVVDGQARLAAEAGIARRPPVAARGAAGQQPDPVGGDMADGVDEAVGADPAARTGLDVEVVVRVR